jgi:hypothetical protein
MVREVPTDHRITVQRGDFDHRSNDGFDTFVAKTSLALSVQQRRWTYVIEELEIEEVLALFVAL